MASERTLSASDPQPSQDGVEYPSLPVSVAAFVIAGLFVVNILRFYVL